MGFISGIKDFFVDLFTEDEAEQPEGEQVMYGPVLPGGEDDITSPSYDLGLNIQPPSTYSPPKVTVPTTEYKPPVGVSPNVDIGVSTDVQRPTFAKPTIDLPSFDILGQQKSLFDRIKIENEERLSQILKQTQFGEKALETTKQTETTEEEKEEIKKLSTELTTRLKDQRRRDILLKDKKVETQPGLELKFLTTASSVWHGALGSLFRTLESRGTGVKTLGEKFETKIPEKIDKDNAALQRALAMDKVIAQGLKTWGEHAEEYYGTLASTQEMKEVPSEFLGVGGKVASGVASVVGSAIPNIAEKLVGGTPLAAIGAYIEGVGSLRQDLDDIYQSKTGVYAEEFTQEEKDKIATTSIVAGAPYAFSDVLARKIGLGKTLAPFKRKLLGEAIEKIFKEAEEKTLKAGASKIVSDVIEKEAVEKVADVSLKKVFAQNWFKSTVAETVDETFQEFLVSLSAKVSKIDPDIPLDRNLLKTAWQTFWTVGLSFGLVEGGASVQTEINKKQQAISAIPKNQLEIEDADIKTVDIQDTEQNEVTLGEVSPKVFEKDNKLDSKFTEAKISDITLKLADIVGGQDARKYQNEFDGQIFQSYAEFVQKSTDAVSEIISTKPALKNVAEKMATVLIGDSETIYVTQVNKVDEITTDIKLDRKLYSSDKDNVEAIVSQRNIDAVKNIEASRIASNIQTEIEPIRKSETPSELNRDIQNKNKTVQVTYSQQVEPKIEKPKFLSNKEVKAQKEKAQKDTVSYALQNSFKDKMTIDLADSRNALATNKAALDTKEYSNKVLSGRETKLKTAEKNRIDKKVELLSKTNQMILEVETIQLRDHQQEQDGTLENAEGWYREFYSENRRNATLEELQEIAKERIIDRAKNELSNGVIDSNSITYLDNEKTIETLSGTSNAINEILNAKDNRVDKYLSLAKAKSLLISAENKLKVKNRQHPEIQRYYNEIKVTKESMPDGMYEAFRKLTREQKRLYDQSTEVFVDSVPDPYVVQIEKEKDRKKYKEYRLIPGNQADSYTSNEIKYRLSELAEEKNFANVGEYFTSLVTTDKYIKSLTEIKNARLEELLLESEEYIDLQGNKQEIENQMRVIESLYSSPDILIKALTFQKLKEVRNDINRQVAIKFKKDKSGVSVSKVTSINEVYSSDLLKKRQRKAIFKYYEEEYPIIGKEFVANLIAKYSSTNKERDIWRMKNENFEKIMSDSFDPFIEAQLEVYKLSSAISKTIQNKELKNADNIREFLKLPKIFFRGEGEKIKTRDLRTIDLSRLNKFQQIINSLNPKSTILPTAQIEQSLKGVVKNNFDRLKPEDTFWTRENFIEHFRQQYNEANKANVTFEGAQAQAERRGDVGYSLFEGLLGPSHLRVGDIFTNMLLVDIQQMHNEAVTSAESLREESKVKYKAAVDSRKASTIGELIGSFFSQRVNTGDIIQEYLNAEREVDKQSVLARMTEAESAYATWIRDVNLKIGLEMHKVTGMGLMKNYAQTGRRKLLEFIKDNKLNIFKAFKEWNENNSYTKKGIVDDYSKFVQDKGYLSTKYTVGFMKERARKEGVLKRTSEFGDVVDFYLKDYAKAKSMNKWLPILKSHISAITEGKKQKDTFLRTSFQSFWNRQLNSEKGLHPKFLGFIDLQGTTAEKIINGLSTFYTMGALGFKIRKQIASLGGEFGPMIIQRGPFVFSNIKALKKAKYKVGGFLGFEVTKQEEQAFDNILKDAYDTFGTNPLYDFFKFFAGKGDNKFTTELRFLLVGGYQFVNHMANIRHYMSYVTKKDLERGYILPKDKANRMLKMGDVRRVDGVSESTFGRTTMAKEFSKFKTYELPFVFTGINTMRKTLFKLSDVFRQDKLYEHVNSKELVRDALTIVSQATTTYGVYTVLKALIEQNLLPEEPEDDNFWQSTLRFTLQDAGSTASGILSFASRLIDFADGMQELVTKQKEAKDPFVLSNETIKEEMFNKLGLDEEFFDTIGMNVYDDFGGSGIVLIDMFQNSLEGILGNTWVSMMGDKYSPADKKKAAENLNYSLYRFFPALDNAIKQVKLYADKDLQPEFVKERREKQQLSKELLGHPYGLSELEMKAYEYYKNISSKEDANRVLAQLRSDKENKENLEIAGKITLFISNKGLTYEEKELIGIVTRKYLVSGYVQENTTKTQAMVLASYFADMKNDDERNALLNKLKSRHAANGILSAEALNTAIKFVKEDKLLNVNEQMLYQTREVNRENPSQERYIFIHDYITNSLGLRSQENIQDIKDILNFYIECGVISEQHSKDGLVELFEKENMINLTK